MGASGSKGAASSPSKRKRAKQKLSGKLFYGDCLTIMERMEPDSVDLIYLDPPFNSQRDYNAIYRDGTGRPLPAQIEAFSDMWSMNQERERELKDLPILMMEAGLADVSVQFWQGWVQALRRSNPNLLAYLSYMGRRLLPMRGLLKATGSIYLHCDPTASHYIKVMLDIIFGQENFRSEVIWKRTSAHSSARGWGPIHDVILYYSRSDDFQWNKTYQAYDDAYVKEFYRHEDANGRYRVGDLTAAGKRAGESGKPWRDIEPGDRHWAPARQFPGGNKLPKGTHAALDMLDRMGRIHWPKKKGKPGFKRYLAEMPGVVLQDIILDVPPLSPHSKERLGYATQKPLALLERIIRASSNPKDLVFDPFCGCATTIEAAHRLKRRWVGIDIAIHAIRRVAAKRLREQLALTEGRDFAIDGVPSDMEGARELWNRDKYHFQRWAVEQVEGYVTTKRSADGGIDGRLFFLIPDRTALSSMVIEVKGGKNVGISQVRELRGVLDQDQAEMAGLVLLEPLGSQQEKNFRSSMAEAGDLEVMGKKYPRMQFLYVADLLEGKRFLTPSVAELVKTQPNLC